jgi:hypothetical protein
LVIACGIRKPSPRGDNLFVWISAQPGSPPAKRAVGDDEVFARTHEPEILKVLPAGIMSDEGCWMVRFYFDPRPIHIIGEDKEVWV